ncbi:MAG: IS4 family transposase, partial [Hyphomicrobiaceae bacterium]
ALIAYLLLRIAHAAQRWIASPLELARLVRVNLLHRRSVAEIACPRPPPPQSQPQQLKLAFAR